MSDNGNGIDKKQIMNDVHTTTSEFRTYNEAMIRIKQELKNWESKLDGHKNELKRLNRAVRDAKDEFDTAKDDEKDAKEDVLDTAKDALEQYKKDNGIEAIEAKISEVKDSLNIMQRNVEQAISTLRAAYGPAIDQAIGSVYNNLVDKNLDSKFHIDVANVKARQKALSNRKDNQGTLESLLVDISDELKTALTHMHNYRTENDPTVKASHKSNMEAALKTLNNKINNKLGTENTFVITEEDLEFMLDAKCFNPTDKSLRFDFMKRYSEHLKNEEKAAQKKYDRLKRKFDKYSTKQEDVIARLSNGTAAPGTAAPGTATPGTAAPGTAAPGTATPGTAAPGTAAPTVEQLTEQLNNLQGWHPIKSRQLKKAIFEAQPIEQLTEQLNNLQGWHPFKRRKLDNAIRKAAQSLPAPGTTTPTPAQTQIQTPTEKDKFMASLRTFQDIANYEVNRYFEMQNQQNPNQQNPNQQDPNQQR